MDNLKSVGTRFAHYSVKAIGCVAFLLSISGCSVGPDFKTPEASVNEEWLASDDTLAIKNETVVANWWQLFGDDNLNQLVLLAKQNNLPLHISALRVFEARAKLGIARGLLLPQKQQITGQSLNIGLSLLTLASAKTHQTYRKSTKAIGTTR